MCGGWTGSSWLSHVTHLDDVRPIGRLQAGVDGQAQQHRSADGLPMVRVPHSRYDQLPQHEVEVVQRLNRPPQDGQGSPLRLQGLAQLPYSFVLLSSSLPGMY